MWLWLLLVARDLLSRRSGRARRSPSAPSPCRDFSPPVRTASPSRPSLGRSSSPNLSGVTTANSEWRACSVMTTRGVRDSAGFGRPRMCGCEGWGAGVGAVMRFSRSLLVLRMLRVLEQCWRKDLHAYGTVNLGVHPPVTRNKSHREEFPND